MVYVLALFVLLDATYRVLDLMTPRNVTARKVVAAQRVSTS